MRCVLTMLGVILGMWSAGGSEPPALLRLDLSPELGTVALDYLGRRLAVYEFRPERAKPCLLHLATLDGRSVLSSGSTERPARRGLALGFDVQDLSFWSGGETAGRQKTGPEVVRRVGRDERGRSVAEVGHTVYWVASSEALPRAEDAWLVEERSVRFVVDHSMGEVAVDWESAFAVGEIAEEVTVRVANDEGFGLQISPEFGRAVLSASDSSTNEAVSGATSGWVSMAGVLAGDPVTVTAFGDFGEGQGFHWKAETEAPVYLALQPTTDAWRRRYRSGERFRMGLLVTVHSRPVTAEALTQRRSAWLEERVIEK